MTSSLTQFSGSRPSKPFKYAVTPPKKRETACSILPAAYRARTGHTAGEGRKSLNLGLYPLQAIR